MRALFLALGLLPTLLFGCGQESFNIGNTSLETRTQGEPLCEETCGCRGDKYLICHYPPGNPDNPQTLCVGSRLVPDHLEHGDACGECPPVDECEDDDSDSDSDEYYGEDSCEPEEPECGDEVCEAPENCDTCETDCGSCPPVCGDEVCEGEEDCGSCERDCGDCPPVCGDQLCERGESCEDCPSDCGECPPECGNEVCEEGESCSDCPSDCGECPPVCGDGLCESGEACETCPADCGECPPVCGDGECDARENCSLCPGDCGQCPIEPEPEPEPEPAPEPEATLTGGGCNSSGTSSGGLTALFLLLLIGALRMKKKLIPLLVVLAVLPILEGPAHAQDSSEFGLERFEMPMSRDSILNVEGANVDFPGTWGLNLFLGYANDPLVLKTRLPGESWERTTDVVGDQWSASVGGFIVPQENLALGLRLPVTLNLDGDNRLSSSGFGDATLMGKYQLWEQEDKKLFDLALGLNLSVPTSTKNYMGETFVTASPYLAASRWLGSWEVAANVGVKLREDKRVADLRVSDELFTRLGVAYGWNVNEVALTFSHNSNLSSLGTNNSNYAEVMGGYVRHFAPGWTGFVGVGTGLNDGFGAPDYRGFLGLRYEFSGNAPMPKCGPLGGTDCPKPDPKPEPKPEPEPKTPILVVTDAYFAFDEAHIKSTYRERLLDSAASISKFLGENKDFDLLIVLEGNTDSIGTKKYNVDLGQRRADAVRTVFMEGGVPGGALRTVSYGETNPRASNSTADGRAANRRVEVYLVGDLDGVDVRSLKGLVDESTFDSFGVLRR